MNLAAQRPVGARLPSGVTSIFLGSIQDQSRDTDWIHPHRHMAPAVNFEPPGVCRKPMPPLGTLRHDVVAITKRHRHGNGDIHPRKRRPGCVECIFERRRSRQVVHHANRIIYGHAPAAHGDRHRKYRLPSVRAPAQRLSKSLGTSSPGIAQLRTHIGHAARGALSTIRPGISRPRSAPSRAALPPVPCSRPENFQRCPPAVRYRSRCKRSLEIVDKMGNRRNSSFRQRRRESESCRVESDHAARRA